MLDVLYDFDHEQQNEIYVQMFFENESKTISIPLLKVSQIVRLDSYWFNSISRQINNSDSILIFVPIKLDGKEIYLFNLRSHCILLLDSSNLC